MNKIILDLCGGTGAWSKPYLDAGYDVQNVTLPEHDVIDYANDIIENKIEPQRVHGILAAPPCDHFSVSGAQYWKQKDIDGRTMQALDVVDACFDLIDYLQPVWWALENPVGRLKKLRSHRFIELLGTMEPTLIFNPCDYAGYSPFICGCGFEFDASLGKYGCPNCLGEGAKEAISKDAYTKKTLLWGTFNIPKVDRREPIRVCAQGSWLQKLGSKSEKTKMLRSITPPGFAQAFFEANP